MQEDKIADADNIASFLIECLAWNTPVEVFHKATYTEVLRCLLIHVYGKTEKEEDCSKWAEVNGIKYLFHASQPWTREQARKFTVAVWNYIGLK
jgi:FPC/CPF motif-containing protein YcgG